MIDEGSPVELAQVIVKLMLNAQDMSWLAKNDCTEETLQFLAYMSHGVAEGYIPQSIAKITITSYIKMRQEMLKHGHTVSNRRG